MLTRFDAHSLRNPLFLLSTVILSAVLLSGCTSDLEDEKFGTIQGNFPTLRDVPDRPNHPPLTVFHDLKKNLIEKREEAEQDHKKNMDQVKS